MINVICMLPKQTFNNLVLTATGFNILFFFFIVIYLSDYLESNLYMTG